MRDRVELLHRLLVKEGSLWVSIDDMEAHYFKVMCDEIFGRSNFIIDIAWKKRDGPPNDRKLGSIHDHILVWGKIKNSASKKTVAEEFFNLMPRLLFPFRRLPQSDCQEDTKHGACQM
jgi:adenine-specific DNA-methyltransferase